MTPRVLILGATSAIAAEVAVIYAHRGARLHLVGRNPDKLAAVAARCALTEVSQQVADLAVVAENPGVIAHALEALGHVDVVLIAHGDLGDQLATEADPAAAVEVLQVNFVSPVSLLVPLANHLEGRGLGTIGVITSVAGDRGRPRNYTYGAAKGGLSTYLQGLRSRLYGSGVAVVTLKLGPVDTPMTVGHAKNALFAKPGPVARAIVRALDRGTAIRYVPGFWWGIMAIVRALPEWLFQRLPFLSGR